MLKMQGENPRVVRASMGNTYIEGKGEVCVKVRLSACEVEERELADLGGPRGSDGRGVSREVGGAMQGWSQGEDRVRRRESSRPGCILLSSATLFSSMSHSVYSILSQNSPGDFFELCWAFSGPLHPSGAAVCAVIPVMSYQGGQRLLVLPVCKHCWRPKPCTFPLSFEELPLPVSQMYRHWINLQGLHQVERSLSLDI